MPEVGVVRRHARLAAVCAGLLKRWTHQQPLLEQRVPTWDRQRTGAQAAIDPIKRAIWETAIYTLYDNTLIGVLLFSLSNIIVIFKHIS